MQTKTIKNKMDSNSKQVCITTVNIVKSEPITIDDDIEIISIYSCSSSRIDIQPEREKMQIRHKIQSIKDTTNEIEIVKPKHRLCGRIGIKKKEHENNFCEVGNSSATANIECIQPSSWPTPTECMPGPSSAAINVQRTIETNSYLPATTECILNRSISERSINIPMENISRETKIEIMEEDFSMINNPMLQISSVETLASNVGLIDNDVIDVESVYDEELLILVQQNNLHCSPCKYTAKTNNYYLKHIASKTHSKKVEKYKK